MSEGGKRDAKRCEVEAVMGFCKYKKLKRDGKFNAPPRLPLQGNTLLDARLPSLRDQRIWIQTPALKMTSAAALPQNLDIMEGG